MRPFVVVVTVALCSMFGCVVLGAPASSTMSSFTCRSTLASYHQFRILKNYTQLADGTLTDNIEFVVSGNTSHCAYCRTSVGKPAVIDLFTNGFDSHFVTVPGQSILLRTLSADINDQGVPEVMEFRDETVLISTTSVRQSLLRMGVVYDFLFDKDTCKIAKIFMLHDSYVASMALSGHSAVSVPVMMGLSAAPNMAPPASSVVPSNPPDPLYNYQWVSGEESVNDSTVSAAITDYYVKRQLSSPADLFVDESMVLIPSDPADLSYAGAFSGQKIATYHSVLKDAVEESFPTSASSGTQSVLVSNGSVAIRWQLNGTSKQTGLTYQCIAIDYFQLVASSSGPKIMRLTRFFDTWAVTLAATNNVPFPQYSLAGILASVNSLSTNTIHLFDQLSVRINAIKDAVDSVHDEISPKQEEVSTKADTLVTKVKDMQSTQIFLILVVGVNAGFTVALLFCGFRLRKENHLSSGDNVLPLLAR